VFLIALLLLYASTFLISLALFLASGWLGVVFFKNPAAALMVKIYALVFFLSPFNIILGALLQGRQRMDLYALFITLQSIILFAATWIMLGLGFGVIGVMYAYVILYFVQYVIFSVLLQKVIIPGFLKIKAAYRKQTARSLLTYGIPVMAGGFAGVILLYTDTALLTALSSLEQVGIYQAALPTANMMLFFMGALSSVLFPLIAELWEYGERKLIVLAVTDLYRYAFALILPMAVATIVYPDIILNLLFGAQYIAGAPILTVLAIDALILTLNGINTAALSGMGKPKETTKAVILGAAINVLANLVLIPIYGGVGAALSTLIAALIIFTVSTHFLKKEIPIHAPLALWLRTLLAGLAFSAVLWSMRFLLTGVNMYVKIVAAGIVGGVLYIALLFLLRVISMADLRELQKRILHRAA
jgi:O-antigen/teichoic acid export membrane protein